MKPIIKEIAVMLDLTTNARLKIVTYLFETLSTNGNVLKITIRELSEVLNVCTNTVTLTLKKLEQENIIKRRTGTIMLHSDILSQWDTGRNHDGSDHGVNINIQMNQKHYGIDQHPNQKKQYETREEKRETAFTALVQQKNAETLKKYKSELSEREKAVWKREKACDLQEASLIEKEKNLRQWEKRLDALLGLEG
ncbi:replication/maintenance protein RepL [Virgibacillus sp. AGTR]|uniref:replication/maintenance protein RepL n=1 Tax=Virgibacillus sp. AGTR TaxID=2812055 RepID=UPI001D165E42|nr:replication/maintenance protein RepL [Virgibacillus sp. AGTR]MCC2248900.1 replication/maintenance protein RepL [Virgibacillus sp. AGTR]